MYRQEGWERFDETSPDFTAEELARERIGFTTIGRYDQDRLQGLDRLDWRPFLEMASRLASI
ncbi:hypothetical protein [Phyllobacterium zundukense]|uniref:Uncharacterized protein n=1 Tax=Phyllobacterium zundukense TaxID=1867719 RepID=A0A2N9VV37_9HYPH|nr:hypothetical protein [Phyllobacterium zundukense]ATU94965.1 hypothetical protein BLM14_24875 [Phyllobacterium zundukense]PIO43355.1 hypothetical protein B5P45_18710 [Phyllobacterium zundukense]